MSLRSAHEGYEYQDLLTAYFILSEILNNHEASFTVDTKVTDNDVFDDLTIEREGSIVKRQIKYSKDHTLRKSDISASSGYQLAIDELYKSWAGYLHKNCQIYLCLAWDEPIDELTQILTKESSKHTFSSHSTNLFRIDIEKLWPENDAPLTTWRRFSKSSKTIDRDRFVDFCNHLFIETDFPKFSLNIDLPGDLERLILEQTDKIGIGIFPNQHITPKEFILGLLHKIKEARAKGNRITSHSIFTIFNIKTDFGAIEQNFPIDYQKNVLTKNTIRELFGQFQTCDKLILVGEPGSGKSWFVNNLSEISKRKGIHIVRHFCYTDLKDELQKERIKLDTFYGNIIADILKEFPELRERKKHLFASTLSELNILLKSITEPTLLIVDGLDHIDRVYNFYQYTDIPSQDIQIINELDKLQCSKNVRILLASQPIPEIKTISGFQIFQLPTWGKEEVKRILQNYHIADVLFHDRSLSDLLCEKSEGNPLYLTYLIKELKGIKLLTKNSIDSLPAYSFNLKEYYNYLITKLSTNESLPRVLSGVNFYLTQCELEEITGEGDYTKEALDIISPILRVNASQNGYIIYHESFRRYILDLLQSKKISIEKHIFQPIIDWFKSKDLFSYAKAYRYGLKFYADSNNHKEIEPFIKKDFVVNSIMHGQTWSLVRRNIKLLANAAISLQNFSLVVTVNELFKTIDSTTDSYNESFSRYIECMGLLNGFDHVANLLSFEGTASIDFKQGLQACYICSDYSSYAPWNLYSVYFEVDKKIEINDFKYYIRYLLVKEDTDRIKGISKRITTEKLIAYKSVLEQEILSFPNQKYANSIIHKTPSSMVAKRSAPKIKNIELIITEIINIKGFSDKEIIILEDFIHQCKIQLNTDDKCKKVVKQLSGRNWFYNWLIYCAKIEWLKNKSNYNFEEIKETFAFLTYDLGRNKGKPRISELYSASDLIYKTLREGLNLIKSKEQWEFAIGTIVKVSQGITTSIQGEIGGPISTDKLFDLFDEISNPINNDYLIQIAELLYEEKKNFHYFTYLSNYCFVISKLSYKAKDLEKSENYFRLGTRYMVSYAWRRDMTLQDGIDSVVSISKIDLEFSKNQLKRLKELADSVTFHTDGKDTKWLPIYWFDEYIKIDQAEASIWLLNQLFHTRFNWLLEHDLKSLVENTNGSVNPLIEQFILNSFIVANSEPYLINMIHINEKLEEKNRDLSFYFANKIKTKLQIKQNSAYSDELQNAIHNHLSIFNIDYSVTSYNPTPIYSKKESTYFFNSRNKELNEMSLLELQALIKQEDLSRTDLHSLMYYFDNIQLTPETKSLIKGCVIGKWRSSNREDSLKLNILFESNLELKIYYNMVCFVWLTDGNYNSFYLQQKFVEAYNYSPQKAIEYLFELLKIVFTGTNRSFSSNLIQALIEVGYNDTVLKEAFAEIINAIDYKIPVKKTIDWCQDLENDLCMDTEEIFLCILLSRMKAYTQERIFNSLTGFALLLYETPDKLIKPLKWFFTKHEYFLDSVLLCVLDILNDYSEVNSTYILNFRNEFEALYPTKYYLIDCVLESFLHKPAYIQSILNPELDYPLRNSDLTGIISLNDRMQKMQSLGFNISNIAGKFKHTFHSKFTEKLGLYSSRSYYRMVQNIYASDYFLKLTNEGLYNDFRRLQTETDYDLYQMVKIQTNALIAQNLSFILRPEDLPMPSIGNEANKLFPIHLDNYWVRLAHFETELKKGNRYEELLELRCLGTFSMGHTTVNSLALECLYNTENKYVSRDDGVIFQYLHPDPLENHQILWLNPLMMEELGITSGHFLNGLIATNPEDDIVLRCNQWRCKYVGNGEIAGIKDEIPLLVGMELIIREDYYKKLISILKMEPKQYTIAFLDI